ncbi:MAG: AbrB/MazE/SpoVT family DNA-binding domain-containing protein [Clostridia bacterium]|nr:AbrB/MazE/SpoVT family DNA-binding domain-containing protein [Clostridia bacterium]
MKKPKGKHAWSVTVGTKGQIVIPAEARALFDIHPGDTLLLLGDEKKGIAIPPKSTFATLFSHIFNGDELKNGEEE